MYILSGFSYWKEEKNPTSLYSWALTFCLFPLHTCPYFYLSLFLSANSSSNERPRNNQFAFRRDIAERRSRPRAPFFDDSIRREGGGRGGGETRFSRAQPTAREGNTRAIESARVRAGCRAGRDVFCARMKEERARRFAFTSFFLPPIPSESTQFTLCGIYSDNLLPMNTHTHTNTYT